MELANKIRLALVNRIRKDSWSTLGLFSRPNMQDLNPWGNLATVVALLLECNSETHRMLFGLSSPSMHLSSKIHLKTVITMNSTWQKVGGVLEAQLFILENSTLSCLGQNQRSLYEYSWTLPSLKTVYLILLHLEVPQVLWVQRSLKSPHSRLLSLQCKLSLQHCTLH